MSRSGKWRNSTENGTYKETIFSKWMTLIFGTITTISFLIWTYEIFVGWNWSDPLTSWFWPVIFLLFVGITVNFLRLKIKITSEGLTVGYGILKKKIAWEKVEDCHLDETSALRYGGWGIRLTRVRGKWRTVYNVVGNPRVVVSLKEGWFEEFVFSTRNPEEVVKKIESHLRR